MKIAVVGTGYVGLVTGTCFAETGNSVTCVDIDKAKIEKLSGGELTIYEPGLEKLFIRNQKEGRLHFTTSLKEGIAGAQIIFLALPTPPGEDGSADLKYILGVAGEIQVRIRPDVPAQFIGGAAGLPDQALGGVPVVAVRGPNRQRTEADELARDVDGRIAGGVLKFERFADAVGNPLRGKCCAYLFD